MRYPNIHVELLGKDGNAFAVMGAVRRALKVSGVSQDEIGAYTEEAMSGDYDHLLRTSMEWVNVE